MQKDIFLSGEGDAWVGRNLAALSGRDWFQQDLLMQELARLNLPENSRILEIGCGEGSRLSEMKRVWKWECFGVDPSAKGVELARAKGINAVQGTADKLQWPDGSFDLVIFGFCLYLCDRSDLFRIAAEANRVLRSPGWVAILDFYSGAARKNVYSHCSGVYSYKMDYRKLFGWHPSYECYSHRIVDHAEHGITDNSDNWIAISVMRKSDSE